MRKLSRILVPTDFSAACERALAQAVTLAARTHAELHVVHVQVLHQDMYGWGAIPNIEAVEEIIANQCRQDLDKAVAKIKSPVVHGVIRDIKAAPAIIHYAETRDIDMIVIGTHTRKGVARMFIGSVANEVLRDAPVSVLVVGPEHNLPVGLYRRILVPVDFSESASAALRQAAAIASQHDAELIAMHVIEPRIDSPYDGARGSPEELRELATSSLDELLDTADLPKRPTHRVVTLGAPGDKIVSYARDEAIDLIVMGTVGLSGLRRLLLGSTTERVLRHAPCAVLAHRGAVYEYM